MSFNKLILVVILLSGCGVKRKPTSPEGKSIPSIESLYIKEIHLKKESEKNDENEE